MTVTLTLEHLMLFAIAILGGGGGIAYLLFRGIWIKSIQPLVLEEIRTHRGKPETVAAEAKAVLDTLERHERDPTTIAQRTKEIIDALDNQVRRDDGIIHRELSSRFKANNEHFDKKMDEILHAVRDRNESQDLILGRMSKLEGMLAVLLRGGMASASHADG